METVFAETLSISESQVDLESISDTNNGGTSLVYKYPAYATSEYLNTQAFIDDYLNNAVKVAGLNDVLNLGTRRFFSFIP